MIQSPKRTSTHAGLLDFDMSIRPSVVDPMYFDQTLGSPRKKTKSNDQFLRPSLDLTTLDKTNEISDVEPLPFVEAPKTLRVSELTKSTIDVKDVAKSLTDGHTLIASSSPRAQRMPSPAGKWNPYDDARLRQAVEIFGAKNWRKVRELQHNFVSISFNCISSDC